MGFDNALPNVNLWTIGGKVVVDANGSPLLCDSCPCGCPPCSTSETLEAVISGIIPCPGCVTVDTFGVNVNSISLSGMFTLTESVPGTEWALSAAGTANITLYAADDCSGSPIYTDDLDIDLNVVCGAGTYSFRARVILPLTSLDVTIFKASGCIDSSLPNANICGVSTPGDYPAGYDGAVTISEP